MESKNTNKKVLICTPTSAYKDYCLKEWSKSIKNLTYDADLLIIDNTADEKHCKTFANYDFGRKTFIAKLPPKKDDLDLRFTMCRCNNYAMNFAIENGYDYMMSIESDVIAPRTDAIEILLSHQKAVCGFAYFIGFAHQSKPIVESEFKLDSKHIVNYFPTDCYEQFFNFDGSLKRVPNLGLGFVLIDLRAVFSKIPKFRVSTDDFLMQRTSDKIHADTFFYVDLKNVGIDTYCDTRYICEHLNKKWKNVWKQEEQRLTETETSK